MRPRSGKLAGRADGVRALADCIPHCQDSTRAKSSRLGMCDTFDADARDAADDPQPDPVVVGDLGPVHLAGQRADQHA